MESKIARIVNKIMASAFNGKMKIEHIKYGEICLSCEIKVGNDDSIFEISNLMEDVYDYKFKPLYDKLEYAGLDYDTGWNRVQVRNGVIVCLMYYGGEFEIEEAKEALRKVGIR